MSSSSTTPAFAGKVKLKIPIARVKKIIQADEEVGKVAQVTPVVISKALELFMTSLISSSCQEAQDRGARRVSVSHLKAAVVKTDQYDFLMDIVSKYPDPVTETPSTATPSAKSSRSRTRASGGHHSNDEGEQSAPKRRKSRAKVERTASPALLPMAGSVKEEEEEEEAAAAEPNDNDTAGDGVNMEDSLVKKEEDFEGEREEAETQEPSSTVSHPLPSPPPPPRRVGLPFDPIRD